MQFPIQAQPIFIDVNPKNYGMCPTALKEFISLKCTVTQKDVFTYLVENKSRLFNTLWVPCSNDEIKSICVKAKIFLIEDGLKLSDQKINGKCSAFGTLEYIVLMAIS